MPISQNLPYVNTSDPKIEQIHQAHLACIRAAEYLHGTIAIDIGCSVGLFNQFDSVWKLSASHVTVEGLERLHR